MFRQAARRLAPRASIHTSARSATNKSWNRAHYAFSASLAATAVLAWQLNAKPIMLDSDASSSIKSKPKARPVAEKEKPVGKSEFVAEDHAPSETPATESSKPSKTDAAPSSSSSTKTTDHDHSHPADHPHDHPHELQDDSSELSSGGAANQGAYNPETGEINWDCPCLGGMAHGPCGPQFREAFSCFIYSEEEPKGIDCVEKFKGMQDCFREHPEIYAQEIMDDEDDESPVPASAESAEKEVIVSDGDEATSPALATAPTVNADA